MFDELRAAVAVARARARRAGALSAAEALELATLGRPRALGLDDEIGSLVAGKQADLAVVSPRRLAVSCPGRIRPRRSSSAERRTASSLLSSTADRDTGKEETSGTS